MHLQKFVDALRDRGWLPASNAGSSDGGRSMDRHEIFPLLRSLCDAIGLKNRNAARRYLQRLGRLGVEIRFADDVHCEVTHD